MAEHRGFPPNYYIERFNQERWRLFEIDNGFVVLTESGLQLPKKDRGILRALNEYKTDVLDQGLHNRRCYLKSGGNSDVYTVEGFPYVVKEAWGSQSIWSSLDRMDYLHSLAKSYLPPHIQVPEHYGAIFSRNLKRQYLLMDKACEGVTVEDIQSDPTIPTNIVSLIVFEMENAAKILRNRASELYPEFDSLLPDFHTGNVIVDSTCETNDYPFKLWIIDQ